LEYAGVVRNHDSQAFESDRLLRGLLSWAFSQTVAKLGQDIPREFDGEFRPSLTSMFKMARRLATKVACLADATTIGSARETVLLGSTENESEPFDDRPQQYVSSFSIRIRLFHIG
jgi:hypothetical protein